MLIKTKKKLPCFRRFGSLICKKNYWFTGFQQGHSSDKWALEKSRDDDIKTDPRVSQKWNREIQLLHHFYQHSVSEFTLSYLE
jgi:hypothetical protein